MLLIYWKTTRSLQWHSALCRLLVGLLSISPAGTLAQSAFSHLNTSDGLAHNVVMDLLQDHNGFLWLGTADGLNRYDGQRFQVYRRSARDARSLSCNEVRCLLEDRQHRLWVGTNSGGINLLDSSGVRFIRLLTATDGQAIGGVTISDLVQDASGTIWAATYGFGLWQIDPRTLQVRRLTAAKHGLPNDIIHQLGVDRSGYLWMGCPKGVLARMRLTDQRVEPVRLPIDSTVILTIQPDRQGRVWVGTQGQGLFRAEAGQTEFQRIFYRDGVVDGLNMARSLYQDERNQFWLGTDDGVVMATDADFRQVTHHRHNPGVAGSLSTHATVCVRGDRQGNLWVGTWEGGLNVAFARPDPFNVYTYLVGQPNSLLAQTVASLAADSVGNVWVGSTQGLTYLDRRSNTFRHLRHQPGDPRSLPGNDITNVHLVGQKLLVSIWNQGTVLLDAPTGRVRHRLASAGPMQVHTVVPVGGGRVRIGTRQGEWWLLDVETGQLSQPRQVGSRASSFTSMLETADGTFWCGTYGEGLLEWPPQNRSRRQHVGNQQPGDLYDNHVTCLFEDRRRQFWVGTMNGLHRYNPRTRRFDLLATDNGLPNDAIMSIAEDKLGQLWVATNDGLCQLDLAGRVVRTYRHDDGLAGNDFTARAVSQSPDGTLMWGGKHGLTVFHPNQLNAAEPPISVYLTELKLFNKTVQPGMADSPLSRAFSDTKAITLRYNQSVISLDFTAVVFRAHRNVRYAYRLDGFDDAWNYVGPQHTATYTNQSPGTYQFRVKASLTDDFQQAPETVLTITILPPWYRTGWAYALYALLVTGLVLGMRRLIQIREGYKTELRAEHLEAEKARELDRLRSGFFTNISHEFRTPLTLILTPLEQFLADRNPDSRRPQWHTMHQNANRLLRLINQLLDLSKLESDSLRPEISLQDLAEFIRRVAGTFSAQAEQQGITLRIDVDHDTYPAWFDADILEKVLYNLIANALNFTPKGGAVTVLGRIVERDDVPELRLDVADTGVGISAEHTAHIFERFYQVNGQHRAKKAGTGIGLALTRELVELHRGRIRVDSEPGEGTAFRVELPIHASAFPLDWLANYTPDALAAEPSSPNTQPADPCPTPPDCDANAPLVLVVEDHDDLRQYIAGTLRQHYRVLTATNGREALLHAQTEIPDLVVSDWLMPDMDGVQLCEALKTDERTSHVPLILLTSRSSADSKVEGLGAGADDYVTKPFNMAVLLSRAQNLILGRRRLRAKYSQTMLLKPTDIVIESAEEGFLRKVLALIETHIADPALDVQTLEEGLSMSNTQFYRKLKALTGKGGNELIRLIRLQRAAQLLQAGGRQVAEVAYAVGFNDPNYFIRAFRKEYGVSPGEWGKQKAVEV